MSFFLFLDESGHDLRESPYEVLAGVCIEDRDLWNLICAVQDAEPLFFGQRITHGELELKGKKLLNKKVFKHARQLPGMPAQDRARLAGQCLRKGSEAKADGRADSGVTRAELTALAQAKIAFVGHMLELCAQYRVKAFASIVDRDAPRPDKGFLRKDYAYLFERYFYFLEEQRGGMGLVVFDELDKSQAHLLLGQMGKYFRDTAKGRMRASLVIPEPFFVHSDLTTATQIADLVAYLIAWGVRVGSMQREARKELAELGQRVCDLRYRTYREDGGQSYPLWSFAVIDDLRPREGRAVENGQ
ncbi:MAG: DUF3800 domain-containing protein [Gammaproteobacteria bacterium]|nr:DUF3800 domain-containing protein [Gammaproteobacteria bacterium]